MVAHSLTIGGSTCERVMNCPGSVAASKLMPPQQVSEFAEIGSMLHGCMELILNGEKTPEQLLEDNYSSHGHTLTKEQVNTLIKPALAAFDQLQEKFGELEFEIEVRVRYSGIDAFGTVDILAHTEKYTFIIDWKFGAGIKVVGGEDNYQLKFYASAAMQTEGVSDMFDPAKPVVLAIIQPTMDEPLTFGLIGHNALTAFGEDVRLAVKRVEEGDETLNSGKWCRWCPAAAMCPAKITQAQGLLRKQPDPIMSPDELGSLVQQASDLDDWIKAVRKFAYAELENGHEVTGFKLVQRRATRSWRDEEDTKDALRIAGVPDDEFMKTQLNSPAQIEKVCKKHGKKLQDLGEDLVVSLSSGTSMVPAEDRRSAVNRVKGDGFLNLPSNDNEPDDGFGFKKKGVM